MHQIISNIGYKGPLSVNLANFQNLMHIKKSKIQLCYRGDVILITLKGAML